MDFAEAEGRGRAGKGGAAFRPPFRKGWIPPPLPSPPPPPTVSLGPFAMGRMKTDCVAIVVGKRGTGKTVLLTDILYTVHKALDLGVAMAPTQESVDLFRTFMPPMSVYGEFRADVIEELIRTQQHAQKTRNAYRNVWVICDDCMFDKTAMRSKAMRDIFMNGRHYNFFFVNLMQYCMDMGPDLRTNVDYVFALRENIPGNREKLFKNFFGVFPSLEEFGVAFDACTANYGAMVLDNTIPSTRVQDCVFWYRARVDLPRFFLGNRNWWKLNHAFYVGEGGGAAPLGGIAALQGERGLPPAPPKSPPPGGRAKSKRPLPRAYALTLS
jgi:hypothetical protein